MFLLSGFLREPYGREMRPSFHCSKIPLEKSGMLVMYVKSNTGKCIQHPLENVKLLTRKRQLVPPSNENSKLLTCKRQLVAPSNENGKLLMCKRQLVPPSNENDKLLTCKRQIVPPSNENANLLTCKRQLVASSNEQQCVRNGLW